MDVVIVDTLAYVADSNAGLRIVDISNQTMPVLRGVEGALLEAQGVDVYDNVAYGPRIHGLARRSHTSEARPRTLSWK